MTEKLIMQGGETPNDWAWDMGDETAGEDSDTFVGLLKVSGPFVQRQRAIGAALAAAAEPAPVETPTDPIPLLLWCPECGGRHIDAGEFATKPHHTHACQYCGHCWRPAIVNTVGVQFLPGFRNETELSDVKIEDP